MKIFFRYWQLLRNIRTFWFWLILLWVISLILCAAPLFDLLAYEFSLVMALVGSLAGANLGARWPTPPSESRNNIFRQLVSPGIAGQLLLIPPLLTITLNALRVKNCDYLEGLTLYFLITGLSMLCAVLVGFLSNKILGPRKRTVVMAIGLIIFSWLLTLINFFAAPPIFAYDPFFGFFPGAIYDEDVAIRSTFLLYRLFNLFEFASLLLLASHFYDSALDRLRLKNRRWQGPLSILTIILALAALGMWLNRGALGFQLSAASIAKRLGGTVHTSHFTIHYSSSLRPEEVSDLIDDHEFRYTQLRQFFGAAPPHITSFIFASAEEKRELIGAHHTYIAKPWRSEVYLQRAAFPHPVLKHELAHVFAAQFGDKLLGLSWGSGAWPFPLPRLNVGMIEGIAVAADFRPLGELTVHQLAASLFRLNKAPSLNSLFGASFIFEASSRSYNFIGSFCRFLYDQYGREKLLELFRRGGDLAFVYQKRPEELLLAWQKFLENQPLPESSLQTANEKTRQPGITKRVCAHEIANLLSEAEDLQRRGQFLAATQKISRVCSYQTGNPYHTLLMIRSLDLADRAEEALAKSDVALADGQFSIGPLRADLEQLRGDLFWRQGKLMAAQEMYKAAQERAAEAPTRRALFLKRWALTQSEQVRATLQAYLIGIPGEDRDPSMDMYYATRLQQLMVESGVGPYLLGKQLVNRRHCQEALPLLTSALHLGLPQDDLVTEAWRLTGQCLYMQKKYLLARDAFVAMVRTNPQLLSLGLEAEDWQSRIAWREASSASPSINK